MIEWPQEEQDWSGDENEQEDHEAHDLPLVLKRRQSYAAKLGKVLPATKVVRYLQIENKIRSIVKFELAAQIPLVS